MELGQVAYAGPAIDDPAILDRLPAGLVGLLHRVNGFAAFEGGLHLRGACLGPDWHSLRNAWVGERAFHRLYAEVRAEDVPFAEDCMGDQFLLREGTMLRLAAESGAIEPLHLSLSEFLARAEAD